VVRVVGAAFAVGVRAVALARLSISC